MESVLALHLQVQSGEKLRLALTHLHLVQLPLQEDLMSSLHAFETCGSVIHTGTQCPDSMSPTKLFWGRNQWLCLCAGYPDSSLIYGACRVC